MPTSDPSFKAGLHRGGDAWRRWTMNSFDDHNGAPSETSGEPAPAAPDAAALLAQDRAEARAAGRHQGHEEGLREGYAAGEHTGREAGFAEGREAGYAEGLETARRQAREEAAQLHLIAQTCAESVGQIEEKMGQALIGLALDIARQVIRTKLDKQPECVVDAVREVLHMQPVTQGTLRLWLHPLDVDLVRQYLNEELQDARWRVLADESVLRGGCRAETPYGDIDGTLQTRWHRVAASLGRDSQWDTP
ncbi:flagellar assembly protein FliH [Schauerella aestuarii]|uniref:flagellar assembly protein FliH n=1 Tax=Schauerella aestuarii TaxID=2511204 RepID=UPI00136A247D|nr:flagellar assembly protein FliH [Achromobacter aestuarii]MYZ44874.1 flagellar assembly protein FliH [Achromobacter aestuarii]